MTLTRQKYGFLLLASTLTFGGVGALWFFRDNPYHVTADDVWHYRQVYIERCMATQYDWTNHVYGGEFAETNYYEYAETGKEDYEFYLPVTNLTASNPPVSATNFPVKYSVVGAVPKPYPVVSNIFEYTCAPPIYWGSYRANCYSNKFILGPYSNMTVSGFSGDYASVNGAYQLFTNYGGAYFYSNGNNVIWYRYDRTEMQVSIAENNYLHKPLVPWASGAPVREGLYGGDSGADIWGVTFTMSGLDTNRIADAPLFTEEPYIGWPIGYGLGTYAENGFNTILLGGEFGQLIVTNGGYEYSDEHYPPFSVAPFYVNPENWGVASFENMTDTWMFDWTLFPTSFPVTGDRGTYTLYAFSDLITNSSDDLVQNEYSIKKRQINERLAVMAEMNTTARAPVWINVPMTNTFRWVGRSTNNYAEAVEIAKTNRVMATASIGPAYSYAIAGRSFYDSIPTPLWIVYAEKRLAAVKADCVCSNFQSDIESYVRPIQVTSNMVDDLLDEVRNVFAFYIANTTNITYAAPAAFVENNYSRVPESISPAFRTNFVSLQMGSLLTQCPLLETGVPTEPTTNAIEVLGYIIDDAMMFFKWTFDYGTTYPPTAP